MEMLQVINDRYLTGLINKCNVRYMYTVYLIINVYIVHAVHTYMYIVYIVYAVHMYAYMYLTCLFRSVLCFTQSLALLVDAGSAGAPHLVIKIARIVPKLWCQTLLQLLKLF